MRDEIKYAVLIGRLLDLLARTPETTEDHRAALRALVDLASRGSATVQVDANGVTVEGVQIPDDTPYAPLVRERFMVHGLSRVHLAHGASAVDLVHLLRALAAAPTSSAPGPDLDAHLRRAKVTTVAIVTAELDSVTKPRRDVRITEALEASAKSAPPAPAPGFDLVPAGRGTAYEDMVRQQDPQPDTLAAAVGRLSEERDHHTLLATLHGVQNGITRAIATNELSQALEAILRLIRLEAETGETNAQRAYGIALRRILTADTLRRFAPLVFDDLYHGDIVMMMRRAGTQGTKVLLDLLIEAPSQAERRAYLKALRQIEEGADVVTSLLSHHEWYVVRNAADLVGELRLAEAAPALGQVVQHEDPRVRRSVGIALARIGTPETALHLRKLLADPDKTVRLAVVREVGGRALGGLAMPLVTAAGAEEDPEVLGEFYRALGRIGTPDAVQVLLKAARSGGLLSRRPVGPRLAAIEGLGLAASPAAIAFLRELAGGRSSEIRAAASAALQRARASGG
jgi:hypothetical protein